MRSLQFLVVPIALIISGSVALAQQAPRDTIARRDSTSLIPAPPKNLWRGCDPGLDLVRSELSGLDRHAGWGMLLGAVGGIAYGLANRTGKQWDLGPLAYPFLGAGAGLSVGSAVYLVRRASGYRPPIRSRCSDNRAHNNYP